MDQRAIIDVVCKTGIGNLAGEIGALLGQDLTCSDVRLELVSKNDLLNDPQKEKSALARMKVSGDQEGQSYLLIGMKAAAILGGTLIMLPPDMIEESANSGELDGELNDAFGEVANIIAGVFTQAFVDKYKKNLRFVKNTVEELTPTKIDLDSDEPFPPGQYYLASCRLGLGDKDLGPLEFITPAHIFELAEKPAEEELPEEKPASDDTEQSTAVADSPSPADPPSVTGQPSANAEQDSPAPPPAKPRKPFAEAKKLVDVVFKNTIGQVGEEIGALLGQTLKCDDIHLDMTSKEEFFSRHCPDKSIMTHMQVSGDKEGCGYLFVQLPDAVVLGGTLIMLPNDEIEEQKSNGAFDGEVADSFGEIANILAGSLTQVFLDRYPQQIRFVKTDSATVVPTKVEATAPEPFPEGRFYLASFAIHLDGQDLDRMQLIFPAEIFDLDGDITTESSQQTTESASGEGAFSAPAVSSDSPAPGEWGGPPLTQSGGQIKPADAPTPADSNQSGGQTAPEPVAAEQPGGSPLVLVISDQAEDASLFTENLNSAGYRCKALSFHDELKQFLRSHQLQGIFLIMSQVGEKGFATAIKLQSAGQPLPPLIFAGPEWTRSAVLRAVKYGARDILVMPTNGDEIQKKATQHLKKAS